MWISVVGSAHLPEVEAITDRMVLVWFTDNIGSAASNRPDLGRAPRLRFPRGTGWWWANARLPGGQKSDPKFGAGTGFAR
jgi:hypothetical protein